MCGICGLSWNDEALVRKMAGSITHRGPDQEGARAFDGMSIAHRRLSILDLSERGRQPMSNEDGTVWITFNGEIYNYAELRPGLEAKGHRFASNTDTEVIIHAYEEYGVDVVNHLRGMFGFAIWDIRNESLLIARDRIGIKPIYYWHDKGELVFASEIKAILEVPDVPRQLNVQALYDYIGFEFVAAPDTMFEGIHKLPAGHRLIYRHGQIKVERYWDLSMKPGAPTSFEEAVEHQKVLLDQCVKSHLMSDVPLGVFLSGGLDSSTLVAMMRRHISGPLRTFTIGYEDKTFSELEYAKQVADQFGTEHHVLMIEGMKPDNVERALWHLDEPMTDLSCVPLMLVCEQARKHITVCLSGEGGDESYAGYDRFKASRLNSYYSMLPQLLRDKLISPMIAGLPDQPQKKGAINMLKRFIEGANLPPEGQHLRWQYFSNAAQDEELFSQSFKSRVNMDPFRLVRDCMSRCDTQDRVNREIYLDMRYMMTDCVLMKVDKMSMASSLEVRVPLLDHVLVEFIASLPGDWKLKGLRTKHVLRAALKDILPDNIVERGKQGYSLPVKNLLRGELKDYMVTLLKESPMIRENLNAATIQRLIDEHVAMKHNHNHVLWALMNVAIWDKRFFHT